MHKPIYIYSSSNFYHAIDGEPPSLKPILFEASGKKIRRIDRLTQLALIGSFLCKANHQFPEKTGLYMSSIFGSINNTASVLDEIYQQGQQPRPLNFINTVSNAACFYLAQQLNLLANNQFISCDHFTLQALIKHASIDLDIGNVNAALVGVVCEVDENSDIHRQRLQLATSGTPAEGSHWLYLAHHLEDEKPIAKITHLIDPVDINRVRELLGSLTCDIPSTRICFSDAVSQNHKQFLSGDNYLTETNFKPDEPHHEFSVAQNICGFLDTANNPSLPDQQIFIEHDGIDQWSLLSLETIK